jgi:hypothetical protein
MPIPTLDNWMQWERTEVILERDNPRLLLTAESIAEKRSGVSAEDMDSIFYLVLYFIMS